MSTTFDAMCSILVYFTVICFFGGMITLPLFVIISMIVYSIFGIDIVQYYCHFVGFIICVMLLAYCIRKLGMYHKVKET